jgi:hypothetical protein
MSLKEPTTKEILKDLTEIAETYKLIIEKFSGNDKIKITQTFWDALTLKLSFFNVLYGCLENKK